MLIFLRQTIIKNMAWGQADVTVILQTHIPSLISLAVHIS